MGTARDLIRRSGQLIGIVAAGESLTANDAADGLLALNEMIESWSAEGLLIPSIVREKFTLTASDRDYTIGSGGNFSTTRPVKILNAMIEDQSTSPLMEYPLELITAEQWAQIGIKDQTGRPTKLYFQPDFPLAIVNLWPMPDTADKIVLYSEKPLTPFASLDTTVSLQPGYARALRYNFAIEWASEFGKSVSEEVAKVANESKEAIQRLNSKVVFSTCDSALPGVGNPYDIFKGE